MDPDTPDSLIRRILRFGISGAASTGFYFVLASIFGLVAGMRPLAASLLAYAASIALSYLLQSRYTFRVSSKSAPQIASFAVVSLWGLMASSAMILVLCEWMGLPIVLGVGITSAVIAALNYVLLSRWVFGRTRTIGHGHSP